MLLGQSVPGDGGVTEGRDWPGVCSVSVVLRKRLLLLFGCMVTLLLVMGVGVVLLLQGVVGQLNEVGADTMGGVSAANAMQVSVGTAKVEVDRAAEMDLPLDPGRWDQLNAGLENDLAGLTAVPDLGPTVMADRSELPVLVAQFKTTREGLIGENVNERIAAHAIAAKSLEGLRNHLDAIQSAMRSATQDKLQAAIGGLQTLALWLGLGFVVVLNVSVIFLSRIAGMILKPIDRLVDASRRLAREEFDHRVELEGRDEFSELARAYNGLAEQLQANEARKIETLYQVARTLTHELNNAIAIIQFQLALAARGSANGALEASRLREIQQALSRMSGTVSALTRVRRIVLTDYLSGVKMLDLEASVAEAPRGEQPAAAGAAVRSRVT